jgi:hypothetical protein
MVAWVRRWWWWWVEEEEEGGGWRRGKEAVVWFGRPGRPG